MSFIATAPDSPAETPPDANTVTNDGFFPDIDLIYMRAAVRLDGTVTTERLRDATVAAILQVNDELAAWKAAQIAAGFATLVEVTAPEIGGDSINLVRYRTAVFRLARADLTERYRDFDATKSGVDQAEKLECTIDDDRRAARWSIRDLLGRPRSTIELI
jgi:hypothetical protein